MPSETNPTPPTKFHETGLVGLFDILGYQSFLEKNEPSSAVDYVLTTLQSAPNSIAEFLKATSEPDWVHKIVDDIRPLIFSDSILLTLGVDEASNPYGTDRQWVVFLAYCAYLQRHLFEVGLPIRGAIAFGRFVKRDTCFAGVPIVEAHKKQATIDAAAVVLCESALVASKAANLVEASRLTVDYLLPRKGGTASQERVLNFILNGGVHFRKMTPGEERRLVTDCFWKHRKDIPPEAYSKVTNTEFLLRFLLRPKANR